MRYIPKPPRSGGSSFPVAMLSGGVASGGGSAASGTSIGFTKNDAGRPATPPDGAVVYNAARNSLDYYTTATASWHSVGCDPVVVRAPVTYIASSGSWSGGANGANFHAPNWGFTGGAAHVHPNPTTNPPQLGDCIYIAASGDVMDLAPADIGTAKPGPVAKVAPGGTRSGPVTYMVSGRGSFDGSGGKFVAPDWGFTGGVSHVHPNPTTTPPKLGDCIFLILHGDVMTIEPADIT